MVDYFQRMTSEALFFFFSSRRRHTIFDCDWSSDVCSSDLILDPDLAASVSCLLDRLPQRLNRTLDLASHVLLGALIRHFGWVELSLNDAIQIGRASCRERV